MTCKIKIIFHKNCRLNNHKNFDVHMSIFSPKKGRNNTIIMEKGDKILMLFICGFVVNFYMLSGFTLKFYQKSNSSPKSNVFKIFKKMFRKKIQKL